MYTFLPEVFSDNKHIQNKVQKTATDVDHYVFLSLKLVQLSTHASSGGVSHCSATSMYLLVALLKTNKNVLAKKFHFQTNIFICLAGKGLIEKIIKKFSFQLL